MHQRKPATSTPAAAPQPARGRGRPPAAAPAPMLQQQPSTRQRRGAGRRQDAQSIQAPASASARGPETGNLEMEGTAHRDMVSAPLPSGESFVSFCFCSAAGPAASGTQNINKRAVYSVSVFQEEESGEPCITGTLPSSSLARQRVVAQEHPSCPFVEPGKGSNTQVPASNRQTPGCHKPQACVSSHTRRNQVSITLHTQTPPPAVTGHHRPRAGSLCFTSLPHHGYVGDPVGSACTVSRNLASAPQSVSVAPKDHQTRLRDSVCPASPQVQGHLVHFSQGR